MKIILIRDNTKKNSLTCITGKKFVVLVCAIFFVAPVVLGAFGYWSAALTDRLINPYVDPDYRETIESTMVEQREEMEYTKRYVKNHLNVLGQRIGSLQAQISRINAVGQRLAGTAGIKMDDFNFDEDPAVGGYNMDEVASDEIDILEALNSLEIRLDVKESEMEALGMLLSNRELHASQTPSGWPVDGGWVSSAFGIRTHPITGGRNFHRGVDIPGKLGANVLVVADGVVTKSEKKGNYGWMVEVNHGDNYVTLYGHNRKNLVKVGDVVSKGQPIAELGSTGRSTGPHVHFEVRKSGKHINPIKYLRKKSA